MNQRIIIIIQSTLEAEVLSELNPSNIIDFIETDQFGIKGKPNPIFVHDLKLRLEESENYEALARMKTYMNEAFPDNLIFNQ